MVVSHGIRHPIKHGGVFVWGMGLWGVYGGGKTWGEALID